MQCETQGSAELTQLCRWIEAMPVPMLTSLDADGVLVSRPMALLEMDGDGVLWFLTDLRSAKVDHLRAVNLSFSDPARARYVSVSGRAEIDADRARIGRLWTPFARTWFAHGKDSAHLALLKFTPEAAEYWDAAQGHIVDVLARDAALSAGHAGVAAEHALSSGLSPPAPAALAG